MLIADKLTPTIRLYAIVTLIRLAYRRWLIHEQARQIGSRIPELSVDWRVFANYDVRRAKRRTVASKAPQRFFQQTIHATLTTYREGPHDLQI